MLIALGCAALIALISTVGFLRVQQDEAFVLQEVKARVNDESAKDGQASIVATMLKKQLADDLHEQEGR